jgi:hypothetical protein
LDFYRSSITHGDGAMKYKLIFEVKNIEDSTSVVEKSQVVIDILDDYPEVFKRGVIRAAFDVSAKATIKAIFPND